MDGVLRHTHQRTARFQPCLGIASVQAHHSFGGGAGKQAAKQQRLADSSLIKNEDDRPQLSLKDLKKKVKEAKQQQAAEKKAAESTAEDAESEDQTK